MPWNEDPFLLLPADGLLLVDPSGVVVHASREALVILSGSCPGVGQELVNSWPELAAALDRFASRDPALGPLDAAVTLDGMARAVRIFRTDDGLGVAMVAGGVDRIDKGPGFALYDRVLRSLDEMVVITTAEPIDRPGPIIVYVNDTFLAQSGHARHEVLGRSPRILQGEDPDPEARRQFRAKLQRWMPGRVEICNVRRDGTPFWVEIDFAPVADETGWFTNWVSTQQVIDARLRASQALAAAVAEADAERALLRATLDAALDPQALFSAVRDAEGTIVEFVLADANQAAAAYFGRPIGETTGLRLSPMAQSQASRRIAELLLEVVQTGQPLAADDVELVSPARTGSRRFDLRATKVGDAASISWRDVTERFEAAERLAESEQRYRLLAENAQDVIWSMTLDGTVTYISPAVETVRGYTPEQAMGQRLDEVFTPDSHAAFTDFLARLRATIEQGGTPEPFRREQEHRLPDGSTFWADVSALPVGDHEGQVTGLLGVTRDISERRRYEDELRKARDEAEAASRSLAVANRELGRLAVTDPLTGIWNRRRMDEAAALEMTQASRYGQPLSMLLFDIDHFKTVNDHFGHQSGDKVLIDLTRRIQQQLRAGDALARWGGEEFLVLLPHSPLADALVVAEKVRALVANAPFAPVGPVTVSIGVAELEAAETMDDWLTRLDNALYVAKESGRNRVVAARGSRDGG